MSTQGKNPERVAAGLKATIHRPNVSEEAKQRAMDRLEEMGIDIEKPSTRKSGQAASQADPVSQNIELADLYESAPMDLPSPGTDRRAKQNILNSGQFAGQQDLQPGEGEEFGNEGRSRGVQGGQPGENRVLGGYRATMTNPNTSQQAKDHAEQILEDNDAI